jgi:hypothetical protein
MKIWSICDVDAHACDAEVKKGEEECCTVARPKLEHRVKRLSQNSQRNIAMHGTSQAKHTSSNMSVKVERDTRVH